jgi:thioredoxin-like negative regulator of GroEL
MLVDNACLHAGCSWSFPSIYTRFVTAMSNTGDVQGDAIGTGVEIESMLDAALDAMANGDTAGAIPWFERVLGVAPGHTEATHGLARALEDAGRIDDALRITEEMIAADPDDVLAVTRLSMLYQHKGMVPEAEAAAARAKILGWKQELRSGVAAKTTL